MQHKEEELVKGCIQKNRQIQREVYEKYAQSMMCIARRYTKSDMEAEDVLQEAFVKVFTKIDTFKKDSTLGAWIKRIVINTALNSQRGKMYAQPMEDVTDFNYQDVRERLMADIAYEQLLAYIRELPSGSQMVFNLHVLEGFNHKEIGEKLGISEGTSKSQLSRAKRLLQYKIIKNDEITANHYGR